MSAIAVRQKHWAGLSSSEWDADVSNGRGIYLYSIGDDAARGNTEHFAYDFLYPNTGLLKFFSFSLKTSSQPGKCQKQIAHMLEEILDSCLFWLTPF